MLSKSCWVIAVCSGVACRIGKPTSRILPTSKLQLLALGVIFRPYERKNTLQNGYLPFVRTEDCVRPGAIFRCHFCSWC